MHRNGRQNTRDQLFGSQPARPKVQPLSLAFWAVWVLIFVFGGLFAVGVWFQDAVPAQRINTTYLPAECTLLDKHVNRVKLRSFNPGRSAISNDYEDIREFGYNPSLQIRYFVAGTEYEVWTFDGGAGDFKDEAEAHAAIEGYVPGESYRCWYDPDDPSKAVIRRLSSYRQNYTGVVVAGSFSLLGLLGLLYCTRCTLRSWRN